MAASPPSLDAERQNISAIAERIRLHSKTAEANPGSYERTIPHTTVSYSMASIPEGEFLMGSPHSDPTRQPDEMPQHPVEIAAFWMQAHTVTWNEYQLFLFAAENRSNGMDEVVDGVSRPTKPYLDLSFGMGTDGFPAINMTQHAANKYAQWLSAKTGEFYRLPTEAEWEYACRAGVTTPFFFGSAVADLDEYAWYAANSGGRYQKVATKKPNAWGLHDMSGNVLEWTLDQYAPYASEPSASPWLKPTSPHPIAVRGGSWAHPAEDLRCAARIPSDPFWKHRDPQLPKSIWHQTDAPWLGFRLVRPKQIPSEDEMYSYWNNGVEQDDD